MNEVDEFTYCWGCGLIYEIAKGHICPEGSEYDKKGENVT